MMQTRLNIVKIPEGIRIVILDCNNCFLFLEHLQNPILNSTLFQDHLPFLLAIVKSALRSSTNYVLNGE